MCTRLLSGACVHAVLHPPPVPPALSSCEPRWDNPWLQLIPYSFLVVTLHHINFFPPSHFPPGHLSPTLTAYLILSSCEPCWFKNLSSCEPVSLLCYMQQLSHFLGMTGAAASGPEEPQPPMSHPHRCLLPTGASLSPQVPCLLPVLWGLPLFYSRASSFHLQTCSGALGLR